MFIAELQKEKYKVEANKIFLAFCRVEEFDLQISDFCFWQFYSNKFNIIVSEPFLELYSLKNTHFDGDCQETECWIQRASATLWLKTSRGVR